ncbi:MAG: methylenetetrahydrofolate reductase, partial [Amylibacter sp.]
MSIIRESFGLSFEFFPPNSLEASFNLWNAIDALAGFAPEFISVTYGAGGSTRELTKSAVAVIRDNYGLEVAGHLTCVNASRAEVLDVARGYVESGANEIVALRGDAPKGVDSFSAHPDGFASSIELIEALAE